LRVGSHAAKVREPRQVRKEAAVSDRLRVPWGDLAGAGRSSRVRALAIDTGCTAVSTHPRIAAIAFAARRRFGVR